MFHRSPFNYAIKDLLDRNYSATTEIDEVISKIAMTSGMNL